MTVQRTFFDWARSGLDWDAAPYEQMSPNLLALNEWLVVNFGGQPLGLDDFDREIRTGGTISDHAYGAALDWRYEPGFLPDTSPVVVARPEALKLVEHIIDWSAELHIDRIHDYVGDRIWTAGRTADVADAHGAWWKPQAGAGAGMGEGWARYFHFATHRDGWADGMPVVARGVPMPGPQPTPEPPTPTKDDDMLMMARDETTGKLWLGDLIVKVECDTETAKWRVAFGIRGGRPILNTDGEEVAEDLSNVRTVSDRQIRALGGAPK